MVKIPRPTKKDALIEKFYREDLFDCDFLLLIGDYSLLKDWAKGVLSGEKLNDFNRMCTEMSDVGRGRQFPMSGGGSIIWLKPGIDNRYLVHEVVHAATHLLRDKGIPVNSDTDELLAYLVERLYQRLS